VIVDLEPMEGTASLRSRFAQPGYLVTFVTERGKLMAQVAGGVMLLVLLFVLLAPRSYTGKSVVLIDPRKQEAVAGDPVLSGIDPDDKIIETEAQMIQSRSIAQQVGEDLNLKRDSEFMRGSGGLISSIKSLFAGEETVDDQNRIMTDKLLEGLDVDRIGTSYAIEVKWTGKDSAEAAKIANQFAQRYVINQIDVKDAATSEVNRKIRDRLTDLRKQLADAEARQLAYRQRTGLVSAMDAGNHSLTLSGLNEQAALARAEAAEQRALLAAANRQRGEAAPAAQASPAVQALRAQAATIGAQAAMLNARYGPNNPAVIQINEQQRQINAALNQEVSRAIRGAREAARSAAAAAAQKAGSSDGSLGSVQGSLGANSAALAKLAALDREVAGLSTLYNTYLSRYNETGVNIGLQTPDARVVSRAVPAFNASFPNVPLTLALGILLAIFAAVGAAIVAELILLLRMRRQEAVLVA
jgi:polysaccharide biosynthesis transport protein